MGTALEVQPPPAVVKPAIAKPVTSSVVLLAALSHPSKATRAAIVAVHVYENSALSLQEAAWVVGAGYTYTATFARQSAADRGRIARDELSLSQILVGERLAAHYRIGDELSLLALNDDELDAQLAAVGRERVLASLDRTRPVAQLVELRPSEWKEIRG